MFEAGRALENKSVWHTILSSTCFRDVEANPLKNERPYLWACENKSFSLSLSLSGSILDGFVGIRVEIPNKALFMQPIRGFGSG